MAKNQWAKRKDASQGEIEDALRGASYFVYDLSWAGRGVPDILCGSPCNPPLTFMVECKTGNGKLTESEKSFHLHFPGALVIANSGACAVTRANEIRAQHLGISASFTRSNVN